MTAPVPPPPLIRLDGVSKTYRTPYVETRALNDVNLTIERGDYVAFTGPSGCGKSTLIALLALLEPWDAGRVILNDVDLAEVGEAERARIRGLYFGIVFQSFHLVPTLSVLDNVALPLEFHRTLSRRDRAARARAAHERVGLGARAQHFPAQLSGGQQQRVAFARAIVGEPTVLLADEPTGNLDSENGHAVMGLIRDAHRSGMTVCLVTHDPRFLGDATRHVALRDGHLLSPHEVTTP